MVRVEDIRVPWLSPLLSPFSKRLSRTDVKEIEEVIDVADILELGLARELTADFTHPLPESDELWKFRVERSVDRQQYRLYSNTSEFLMFGSFVRETKQVNIYLYDPADSEKSLLYNPSRPAFSLRLLTPNVEWLMVQERCDQCRHIGNDLSVHCPCEGHREVLHVLHSDTRIGHGVSHCMDASVPAVDDFAASKELRLISKLPRWNKRVECLVLDIVGRRILSSAKNFQLILQDDPERVVCQHGKIGTNSFGLDFRYPLNVAQAFGVSLATMFWS